MAERLGELTRELRGLQPEVEAVRYAHLLLKHKGNLAGAAAEAERLIYPNLPRILKTGVGAGTTTTTGNMAELTDYFAMTSAWVTKTSRRTFLGRLPYSRVPFMTRTPIESATIAADFVAEGGAINVAAPTLAQTATLARRKLAIIIAVDDELTQVWSPASQANLDAIMTLAVARGLDSRALDPDSAAIVGTRPASLLSGIAPLGLFGSTAATALTSIQTLLAAHVAAGSDLERCVIGMHPSTALTLSLLQNSNGNASFPQLNANGGAIVGVPVVTSVSAQRSGSPPEKVVCVVDGQKVLVADDGEAEFAASRLTSLQLDSAPSGSSATPTPTNVTSMYQTSSAALKIVRHINFQLADSSGACWMTSTF